MNRRIMLASSLGAAALLTTGTAGANSPKLAKPVNKPAGTTPAQLQAALADCYHKGLACAAHCERELASGNREMAKCATTVADMLALVEALLKLSTRGSSHTAKLAALCAEACSACELACKAHEPHFAHGMHLECKACMEACRTCAAACRAA